MRSCSEIPAAAWQQLVDGAKWPKLAKVSFPGRLGGQLWRSGGAEVLCRFGCKKPPVLDVLMPGCSSPRCFDSESQGIEAAAGLLALLSRCPELKDVPANLLKTDFVILVLAESALAC